MIVIPMAGASSRFTAAGYTRPKYELPVHGESLFACCVRSFEAYFANEPFLFVCRSDVDAQAFVREECARLGVENYACIALNAPTRGQAETVLLGLERADSDPAASLLIFNIDTIRPGYMFPEACRDADGYLEVFAGEGDHWSFVRPAAQGRQRVAETSEKKRISNLCCTGLYQFARAGDFTRLARDAADHAEEFCRQWKELYVAPLYNAFIAGGADVAYHEVAPGEVLFSGTPDEYRQLLAAPSGADATVSMRVPGGIDS
jgi:hypothetical protein